MSKAVVVLSGGQDSTTCLWWAKEHFDEVLTLSFYYGQRHMTELEAAKDIAALAKVPHKIVDLTALGRLSRSALTDHDVAVSVDGGLHDLPSTFTPGRNLVFLTLAASYAISEGSLALVTGVCQTDYSGYPDCRETTINALEVAIRLGNDLDEFRVHTPLMHLTKAETVKMARGYGDDCWKAVGLSLTCYNGKRPGCGTCPACELRAKGFAEAGMEDPANGQ